MNIVSKTSALLVIGLIALSGNAFAQGSTQTEEQERADRLQKIRALPWVNGPSTVSVDNNAKLTIPEHYLFLDAANTSKFDELTKNLSSGKDVMVGPEDLHWRAYLVFDDEGYVKDDEKIDAPALLKTLKERTADANQERQKRGYQTMELIDWASPPAYNSGTKRLEWATLIENQSHHRGVNFFTKILGRHGYTSVVMVARSEDLAAAEKDLDQILNGYKFNPGETYAEFKPGDKVAKYGLAALVLGGAAAIAAKKGLFGVLGTFLVATWKFLAAGIAAVVAWARSLVRKKT